MNAHADPDYMCVGEALDMFLTVPRPEDLRAIAIAMHCTTANTETLEEIGRAAINAIRKVFRETHKL